MKPTLTSFLENNNLELNQQRVCVSIYTTLIFLKRGEQHSISSPEEKAAYFLVQMVHVFFALYTKRFVRVLLEIPVICRD